MPTRYVSTDSDSLEYRQRPGRIVIFAGLLILLICVAVGQIAIYQHLLRPPQGTLQIGSVSLVARIPSCLTYPICLRVRERHRPALPLAQPPSYDYVVWFETQTFGGVTSYPLVRIPLPGAVTKDISFD